MKLAVLWSLLALAWPVAYASPGSVEFQKVKEWLFQGEIPRDEARSLLLQSRDSMWRDAQRLGCAALHKSRWVFPLPGYDLASVGGAAGEGFQAATHDYLDGNLSRGHAALDIFVDDVDQDGRDDRSGGAIPVVSISGGLVVATNMNWVPGDPLRGGNYVYVYVPGQEILFYYAHLDKVTVEPGTCVNPGALLGSLGRTGLNAYAERSPTHLHLARYQLVEGVPFATNPYGLLKYLTRGARRLLVH